MYNAVQIELKNNHYMYTNSAFSFTCSFKLPIPHMNLMFTAEYALKLLWKVRMINVTFSLSLNLYTFHVDLDCIALRHAVFLA